MKRDFQQKHSFVAGNTIPSHILRGMYALDASCDYNPAMDNSLRNAVLGDDPHLVLDLRHINKGRPGDTFDLFFNKLMKWLEEHAAADERMNNVEHTSNFLSDKDLIEQAQKQ